MVRAAATVLTVAAVTAVTAAAAAAATAPAETATAATESQLSKCAARELGNCNPNPEDDDVSRGRTRGENTRHREAAGNGLLSLTAARESIGHVLFHQAPPHDDPLPHAR